MCLSVLLLRIRDKVVTRVSAWSDADASHSFVYSVVCYMYVSVCVRRARGRVIPTVPVLISLH